MTAFRIDPRSAKAFPVLKGQVLRIIDIAGGQPGDLVAYNLEDMRERFSQARTRVENRRWRITAGHRLWSNAQPPRVMFSVTEDTAGDHDLLFSPCCRYALELRFGVSRDGCLEHLAGALAPHGVILAEVPDPLSLFFSVTVAPDGTMAIGEHRSGPGDLLALRAEIDCLVAISTCSVPIAGRQNSGYLLEIVDG
jgi:uncharacterized protein YcgI (DUF1989 family)